MCSEVSFLIFCNLVMGFYIFFSIQKRIRWMRENIAHAAFIVFYRCMALNGENWGLRMWEYFFFCLLTYPNYSITSITRFCYSISWWQFSSKWLILAKALAKTKMTFVKQSIFKCLHNKCNNYYTWNDSHMA